MDQEMKKMSKQEAAGEYVMALENTALLTAGIVENCNRTMNTGHQLLVADGLHDVLAQKIRRMSTILQVYAVESIRAQADIQQSLDELHALEGRYVKVKAPKIEIVK